MCFRRLVLQQPTYLLNACLPCASQCICVKVTTFCSCLHLMMTSTPFVSRSTRCGSCLEGLSCSRAQLYEYDEISAHVTYVSATSRSSVSRIPTVAAAAAASRTALLSLTAASTDAAVLVALTLPPRPHTFCRLVV